MKRLYRRPSLLTLTLILLFVTLAPAAFAQSDFAIINAARSQWSPAVAYSTTSDTYLIVYVDNRAESGTCVEANYCTTDIKAKLMRSNRTTVADITIAAMNDAQKDPDVVYNVNTNEFLVVWYDNRYGSAPTGYFRAGIYAMRVNAGNGQMSAEVLIHATPTENHVRPRVSYNTNSASRKYLVVWQGAASNTMGNLENAPWRVYGRLVGSGGTPQGSTFRLANWDVQQENPTVAANSSNGDFAVAWEDRRADNGADGADRDIYAQVIRNGQRLLSFDITIAAYSVAHDRNPSAAYNPDDNQYMVAWHDGSRIEALRVNAASGSLILPIISISASGNKSFPSVTYCAQTDRYLFAWQRASGSTLQTLQGQKFGRTGAATTGVFNVSTGAGKAVRGANCTSTGQILTVWEDWRSAPANIYGSFIATP